MERTGSLIPSVSEAVGNTPLVRRDRITRSINGTLIAKLEMLNPGFSKKDRVALQIILDAEESGELNPGQAVVELTSGNMGTGLAIVCGNRGYPFVAVMSKGNSEERMRMMTSLGAEVILVDQLPGSIPGQVSGGDLTLVEQVATEITELRGAFRADQFHRSGNMRAHYLHTGPEIWSQCEGNIDAFCDFVGSGGTFAGVTKYLKEQDPSIQCYVVEPVGAAAAAGCAVSNPHHPIQGGGYALADLDFLKDVPIDGYLEVSSDEARHWTRRLAKEEGIFAGFSTGANLAAAMQLLQGPMRGKTVAMVVCDSGLKYLSTDLWH